MQAALQPVSSSDKLELVDQLTDYVSDALAEVKCRTLMLVLRWQLFILKFCDGLLQGSLADDELQYLFQARQHGQPSSLLPYVRSRASNVDIGVCPAVDFTAW